MMIPGARRAVLGALRRGPATAEDVFKMINWWTLPTIEDTLRDLRIAREIVDNGNGYKLVELRGRS